MRFSLTECDHSIMIYRRFTFRLNVYIYKCNCTCVCLLLYWGTWSREAEPYLIFHHGLPASAPTARVASIRVSSKPGHDVARGRRNRRRIDHHVFDVVPPPRVRDVDQSVARLNDSRVAVLQHASPAVLQASHRAPRGAVVVAHRQRQHAAPRHPALELVVVHHQHPPVPELHRVEARVGAGHPREFRGAPHAPGAVPLRRRRVIGASVRALYVLGFRLIVKIVILYLIRLIIKGFILNMCIFEFFIHSTKRS